MTVLTCGVLFQAGAGSPILLADHTHAVIGVDTHGDTHTAAVVRPVSCRVRWTPRSHGGRSSMAAPRKDQHELSERAGAPGSQISRTVCGPDDPRKPVTFDFRPSYTLKRNLGRFRHRC